MLSSIASPRKRENDSRSRTGHLTTGAQSRRAMDMIFQGRSMSVPLRLVLLPPHHRPPPHRIVSERRNHCSHKPSTDTVNKETPDAEEVHERLKCDGLLRLGLMERLIGN
jgi:hypothetical protein